MEIETRRLADLKPADYNPRKKLEPGDPEYEKIARSIEEFGYCDPIIINRDGTIIGGHQRTQVLLDMGAETADCVVVDLDPDKEKALNIAPFFDGIEKEAHQGCHFIRGTIPVFG